MLKFNRESNEYFDYNPNFRHRKLKRTECSREKLSYSDSKTSLSNQSNKHLKQKPTNPNPLIGSMDNKVNQRDLLVNQKSSNEVLSKRIKKSLSNDNILDAFQLFRPKENSQQKEFQRNFQAQKRYHRVIDSSGEDSGLKEHNNQRHAPHSGQYFGENYVHQRKVLGRLNRLNRKNSQKNSSTSRKSSNSNSHHSKKGSLRKMLKPKSRQERLSPFNRMAMEIRNQQREQDKYVVDTQRTIKAIKHPYNYHSQVCELSDTIIQSEVTQERNVKERHNIYYGGQEQLLVDRVKLKSKSKQNLKLRKRLRIGENQNLKGTGQHPHLSKYQGTNRQLVEVRSTGSIEYSQQTDRPKMQTSKIKRLILKKNQQKLDLLVNAYSPLSCTNILSSANKRPNHIDKKIQYQKFNLGQYSSEIGGQGWENPSSEFQSSESNFKYQKPIQQQNKNKKLQQHQIPQKDSSHFHSEASSQNAHQPPQTSEVTVTLSADSQEMKGWNPNIKVSKDSRQPQNLSPRTAGGILIETIKSFESSKHNEHLKNQFDEDSDSTQRHVSSSQDASIGHMLQQKHALMQTQKKQKTSQSSSDLMKTDNVKMKNAESINVDADRRKKPLNVGSKQKNSIISNLKKDIEMDKQQKSAKKLTESKVTKKSKNSSQKNIESSSSPSKSESQKQLKFNQERLKVTANGKVEPNVRDSQNLSASNSLNHNMLRKTANSQLIDLSELIQSGYPTHQRSINGLNTMTASSYRHDAGFVSSAMASSSNSQQIKENGEMAVSNGPFNSQKLKLIKVIGKKSPTKPPNISSQSDLNNLASSSTNTLQSAATSNSNTTQLSKAVTSKYSSSSPQFCSSSNAHASSSSQSSKKSSLPLQTVQNANFMIEQVDESQAYISQLKEEESNTQQLKDSKHKGGSQIQGHLTSQSKQRKGSDHYSGMSSSAPFISGTSESSPKGERRQSGDSKDMDFAQNISNDSDSDSNELMSERGRLDQSNAQSDTNSSPERRSNFGSAFPEKKKIRLIPQRTKFLSDEYSSSKSSASKFSPNKNSALNIQHYGSTAFRKKMHNSIPRHHSLKPKIESLNDVTCLIEEHVERIWAMYLYIDNSKSIYRDYEYQLQKLEFVHFLLLKKCTIEMMKVWKCLNGKGNHVFTLSEIEIPQNILEQYIDRQQIRQEAQSLSKEFQNIRKQLEQTYNFTKNKYFQEPGFDLQLDKDDFSYEIIKKLREQLLNLYDKWESSNLSQQIGSSENKDTLLSRQKSQEKYEQRMIEIIQIMFLISEFSGKSVKACSLLKESHLSQQNYFKIYYETNYERLMDLYEQFDKAQQN